MHLLLLLLIRGRSLWARSRLLPQRARIDRHSFNGQLGNFSKIVLYNRQIVHSQVHLVLLDAICLHCCGTPAD